MVRNGKVFHGRHRSCGAEIELRIPHDPTFEQKGQSWFIVLTCPSCMGRVTIPASQVAPPLEELADSVVPALDGCLVEPDGTCEHGYPSWLLALGLI